MASQLVFAMAVALVLIALTALPTGMCGPSGRIQNGEPARVGQFPYMASIWAERNGHGRLCQGPLITKYAVLTSGICGLRYNKFTIRLGGIHRTEEENNTWSTTTTWALLHPDYDPQTEDYSLTILFFANHVPLRENIKVVALPPSPDVGSFVGQHAIIRGWGYTGPSSGFDETLSWYEVMVIPNRICEKLMNRKLTSRMLCAGGETTGVGEYDDGAPLVVRTGISNVLIGTVSKYRSHYNKSEPAIYTRISSMLNWIRDEAGIID